MESEGAGDWRWEVHASWDPQEAAFGWRWGRDRLRHQSHCKRGRKVTIGLRSIPQRPDFQHILWPLGSSLPAPSAHSPNQNCIPCLWSQQRVPGVLRSSGELQPEIQERISFARNVPSRGSVFALKRPTLVIQGRQAAHPGSCLLRSHRGDRAAAHCSPAKARNQGRPLPFLPCARNRALRQRLVLLGAGDEDAEIAHRRHASTNNHLHLAAWQGRSHTSPHIYIAACASSGGDDPRIAAEEEKGVFNSWIWQKDSPSQSHTLITCDSLSL